MSLQSVKRKVRTGRKGWWKALSAINAKAFGLKKKDKSNFKTRRKLASPRICCKINYINVLNYSILQS